jgi:DNA repair protein RadC
MLLYGPGALSSSELLAIILRTGTEQHSALGLAELLLSRHGGLLGVANASPDQFSEVRGIGPAKAVQIAACVELGKRIAAYIPEQKPMINDPDDAIKLLIPEMRDCKKELFKSILLDIKNRVIRIVTVSIGSLDMSVVHPREVYKDAIIASASGMIVAHNHPSGDPTPSSEDRRTTARLTEAGKILGIELLDHLIIGDGRWVSLKQQGMM